MKILVGVYNPIAYDGRVQRACEALSQIGKLILVCPDGAPVPEGLPFDVHTASLPNGVQLRRHLAFWKAFLGKARRIRPEVIHAHDYYMAFPGVVARQITGAKLIYDAHELTIPEPGVPMGRRKRFWHTMERLAVHRAEQVIAANVERARLMAKHYKLRKTPLVIRNIPPRPPCTQGSEAPAIARSAGERLCVYQGDVSLARGLGRFLQAIPLLPETIRLVIIGGGPDEMRIKKEIERLRIQERVTMLGRVPREQLAGILRTCDVGLISYPYKGLNNIYCAPNKIFEYAQAGLPVVATDQPPLKRMVATEGLGETVGEHESPQQVAEAIRTVMEKSSSYGPALKRFLAEHRWEDEAARLTAIVGRILKPLQNELSESMNP